MMLKRNIIGYNFVLCLVSFIIPLAGCSTDKQKQIVVDSLNLSAYRMRFVSLDSTSHLANEALAQSVNGTKGRAEALGNCGFVKYMEMDYEESKRLYQASYDECDDDLTRLMACVGLMKICQVTSQNKDFFDYSMKAEKYLDKDCAEQAYANTLSGFLTETEWNYGHSEFSLASATFYDIQLQDRESRLSIRNVRENMDWVEKDTAQLARYYTLCSSIGQGSSDMNVKMQYLTEAYLVAKQKSLKYMEACALQKMADLLITDANAVDAFSPFTVLWGVETGSNETGILFANKALEIYKEYGSIYSRALAYLTISTWYLNTGHADIALDSALQAAHLALIDAEDIPKRSLSPLDWIAKIHEHLSIVYASLGDKELSDRHRNAYLDILDETRQDKQFEQRKDILISERRKLMWLKSTMIGIGIILLLGVVIASVLIRKRRIYKRRRLLELIEEERAVLELRLKKNKRSYIDKCTSLSIVSGIMPFLSRGIKAINDYMSNGNASESRAYAIELFNRINEYNDVLTHWIKMKQGVVKLHIESFRLQPLFDTLESNRKSFGHKGLELFVEKTEAIVKADRVLTLFMMNTLLDNARKFTDKGYVKLSAKETEKYVEICVEDTGIGIDVSENDVYSSRKGFGFGLMNCRGIIEKYKKTSRQFDVCQFDMKSRVGEGSQFSFRLPKGIVKMIMAVGIWTIAAGMYAENDKRLLDMDVPNDSLLTRAHVFADSTFYANVNKEYDKAITFGDSVITYLNKFYQKNSPDGSKLMVMSGGRYMPELDWWSSGLATDYVTILDVRNELAIAALAINDLGLYQYNNKVYARLYRLCGQDKSLEAYCETLAKTNHDTWMTINIVILLIVMGIIIYMAVQRYMYSLATQINNEENRRIEYEDNNLHVQNMVLDNCLSTLKHETMYYPSKILNMLMDNNVSNLKDAEELAVYYERVFSMLSEHAMSQLDKVQFKRRNINCNNLVNYFQEKIGQKHSDDSSIADCQVFFIGDEEMMKYMIDNLVDIVKEQYKNPENMQFYFVKSEGFVKFAVEVSDIKYDDEELNRLFFPESLRYDSSRDLLIGVQYILCKQIIREHDEHCGHRGCRIFAEHTDSGGTRIVFTLPHSKQ